MRLNTQKFSLSAAIGAGAVYAACTLFVIFWPSTSTKLMGWLFHLSNPEVVFGTMRVTAAGYIGGIIEVVIYTFVISLIFVWIFNRSIEQNN